MKTRSPVLQCRKFETVAFPAEIACHYVLLLVKSSCEIPYNSVTIPEHDLKLLNLRRQVPHVFFIPLVSRLGNLSNCIAKSP